MTMAESKKYAGVDYYEWKSDDDASSSEAKA